MNLRILEALNRKKTNNNTNSTPLARVLSLLDLTALGVGSTLGLGIYVLAGSVAKTIAGPAVCISFVVAGIASAFAALCYAEFAARVPKAGSAYIYSYVTIGEFIAFFIGWNLILEYVIGTASIARGLSNYIDSLVDRKIKTSFAEWMPMQVNFLAPYPDFLSFSFVIMLTALLAFGVKESVSLHKVLTLLNLTTITIAIVAGSINADVKNWKIPLEDIEEEYREQAGSGGFAPFGFSGVMAGAARCFFGFVGFDGVATTGEEAKNPQRDIPLAIIISLVIICGAYFAISTVLTMAWPYYLQNADAPFPYVFDQYEWYEIKWIITIGAIFAMCCSLLGAMFPLPRILYAMSTDGVIFKSLAKVNSWTKTPLLSTISSGLLSAIMATVFDLEQLIDTMTIATLAAYSVVAICVLILRYAPNSPVVYVDHCPAKQNIFARLLNLNNDKYPCEQTSYIVNWSIVLFSIFTALFCATIINGHQILFQETLVTLAFAITLAAVLIFLVIMIRQPTNKDLNINFMVPLVPYIPCISIMFNVYLILELGLQTWIRYLVWLVIGFSIYFSYGIRHSAENKGIVEIGKTNLDDQITKM